MSERTRSILITAAAIALVLSVALAKSFDRSLSAGDANPEDLSPTLEEVYANSVSEGTGLVIGFFLEGYICCEGTQIMYDGMRASLEDLVTVAADEFELAALLIDIASVAPGDRSFAWKLAGGFGIESFNGVAMLTPTGEVFRVILGPYYSLPQMKELAAELARL